jgi:hypothetical protein
MVSAIRIIFTCFRWFFNIVGQTLLGVTLFSQGLVSDVRSRIKDDMV